MLPASAGGSQSLAAIPPLQELADDDSEAIALEDEAIMELLASDELPPLPLPPEPVVADAVSSSSEQLVTSAAAHSTASKERLSSIQTSWPIEDTPLNDCCKPHGVVAGDMVNRTDGCWSG